SYSYSAPPHLPSFPTRRSSDLGFQLRSVDFKRDGLHNEVNANHHAEISFMSYNDSLEALQWSRCHADTLSNSQMRKWLSSAIKQDRKSTRLNSSHRTISYAVFC